MGHFSQHPRGICPESIQAFSSGNKARSRAVAYDFVLSRGAHGATADEASESLGLSPNQIAPRFVDLHKDGLIIKVIENGEVLHRRTRLGSPAAVFIAVEVAWPKQDADIDSISTPADQVALDPTRASIERERETSAPSSPLPESSTASDTLFGDISVDRSYEE